MSGWASMASRAPLLVAAALFLVGVAGLVATLPGSDAGQAFLAPPRAAATEAPAVDSGTLAKVADVPQIPVRAEPLAPDSDAVGVVADATVVAEAPVPSPMPPHGAVIAAVAADEPPTPPPLHPVLISADGGGDSTTAVGTVTATPTPSPTPAASPTP